MSGVGSEWCRWRLLASTFIGLLVVALLSVSAQSSLKHEATTESKNDQADPNHVIKISSPKSRSSYKHIWPDIKFGWKIVVGAIIGFFGAACWSVGGDGGGGIFLPMLNLIVGFDAKSSVALARFMSTKAFLKGVESWKKETITKREAARCLELNEEFKFEPESLSNDTTPEKTEEPRKSEVSIMQNIYWKELGLLVAVWAVVLALQIAKIPVAGAVSAYEAIALYKGRRKIASKGDARTKWRAHQLVLYCACGIMAGVVGGLLGLGGGFILSPLFLELGIHPQVHNSYSLKES
ncbi:hypothetical protein WN943_022235 [Citrus x changshan-huyou]